MVCVRERQLRWFDLSAGEELASDADGIVRVRCFPGLWIDVAALLNEERRLLEQRERPETPEENQHASPRCGSAARYRGTATRLLITSHAEHSLRRRRYYCASCHLGFSPLDQALSLDRAETSQQVRLWVAELAPRVAIRE